MDIKIVKMTKELINDIYNIEVNSFSTPWSKDSLSAELDNPNSIYFAAINNGTAVGYVGAWSISGQCDINNVAVLPKFRRKGIASTLIKCLCDYCKSNSLSPITLEVRESNEPAKTLYESFGFEPIGFRKNYYRDTNENAIIMSLNI